MFRNKYSGDCRFCGLTTRAGEGYYFSGYVFCSEPVDGREDIKLFPHGFTCLKKYNQTKGTEYESAQAVDQVIQEIKDARQKQYQIVRLAEMLNGELQSLADEAKVRSLDAVIEKVAGTQIALVDLDWDTAIQVSNELVKRIDRKKVREQNKSLQEQNICSRCMGAGGADKWAATGWYCHKCHGSGKHTIA